MIPKRKKPRPLSTYTRQLLDLVDEYVEASGDDSPDLYEAACWAYENGKLEKASVDVIRITARAFARACRQDYIKHENGEPVRHRHAVREKRGDRQLTLWPKMENMSPEKMRLSLQVRKIVTVQDVIQMERDRRYFNKHYNPGDPIEMDYNLNVDVEEHFLPTDYPDAPPDADHSEDS
jgi:hypothetical protein